ncbi:sulfatase-like hydrolase/transferase [Flavicella marina]|uniref:sulfatase-like hydrolase/transferase n=1 Tax=Flavicella marina TaxID=1475951 RepID=UPI001263F919|nr:sulfatase-like hydrolase/transferase [Flavicella marina]
MTFKSFISVITLLIVSIQTTFASDPPLRPNIIFILADDLGYADVGFNGGTDVATPNLDKLATDGTIFSSAYVAHSFCGPSRAGLLTGRYPHALGSQFNLPQDTPDGIDTNEKFFSKVLQESDYNTGLIGKWHLGEEEQYHPNNRGFDYFYGFLGGGHKYFTSQYLDAHANGQNWDYLRPLRENFGLANEPRDLYITDLFSTKGVEFIQNAEANDDEPFMLFMSYNAPHSIIEAKQSDKDALSAAPYNFSYTNDRRHIYAAMVYSLDRGVKELVDALKANGEFDNTLIVFLSDNGGRTDNIGMGNNTPLRGAKGDTFEGGFRVPMFFHWPAKIPAGSVYDYPVSALDFYPMFANLAGATIPNSKVIDGIDILDDVVANTNARSGKPIFAMRHTATNNRIGVRKDQWKLYSAGNGVFQLYNITNDIGETTDVSSSNADIMEEMIEEAYNWSKTHIQPLFFDNPSLETNWQNNNMPNWNKTFPSSLAVTNVWEDETISGYVYPNPTDKLSLSIGFNSEVYDPIDVTIFDQQGRLLQKEMNIAVSDNGSVQFEMNNKIKSGHYVVHVKSGAITFARTLIVEMNS